MEAGLKNIKILRERNICDVRKSSRNALNVHFDCMLAWAELGNGLFSQKASVNYVCLLESPLKTSNVLLKLILLIENKFVLL